jgi:hypothetical protein
MSPLKRTRQIDVYDDDINGVYDDSTTDTTMAFTTTTPPTTDTTR